MLPWNQKLHIWHVKLALQSVSSIVWQFNIVQELLLDLNLLHVNNLRQEVGVLNELVVNDVLHHLLNRKLWLDTLLTHLISQLQP